MRRYDELLREEKLLAVEHLMDEGHSREVAEEMVDAMERDGAFDEIEEGFDYKSYREYRKKLKG